MSKTKQSATEVLPKAGPGFHPGHPRVGGRKKRTAQMARDLADSMGCDPLEFMMRIVNSDTIEQTVIAPDGKKQHIEVAIPLDTRMDAAKAVANYLYPKLNATAVTGANDGPVLMASQNLSVLMSSSEAVELAQRLALLMAESTPARIISPDEIQTPAPS